MTDAIIHIPSHYDLKKLPEDIIYKAFSIAIALKNKEIKKELRIVEAKIKKYEKKYQFSFSQYEKNIGDTLQAHEDWLDWSFLELNRKELHKEMQALEIQ